MQLGWDSKKKKRKIRNNPAGCVLEMEAEGQCHQRPPH